MNKVILIGNVGNEPEIKEKVAKISLATTEKTKNGNVTEWHKVVMFGESRINFVKNYVKKGSSLIVEGRIQYEQYEKDGKKHSSTNIICDNLQFCPTNAKKEQSNEKVVQVPTVESANVEQLGIPF